MYTKLLVPIDGTDFSERAMHGSIELARKLGAEIAAFIAEPTMPLPAVGRPLDVVQMETDMHELRTRRHAEEVLRRFEAQARNAGVPFSGHHAQTDRIGEAIASAAEEQGCDMIVMATHGRGPFGELMFGSHTKRVMATSKLPLLVLH
jgi:nucleotide-binding universal stress UspA family protein